MSTKVLITHERFAPDFGGGGEYIVERTAHHLKRQGVDVRVLTTGDPSLDSHNGIRTQRLPISRYRLNLAHREVAEAARHVDLIHTFNYHACLPALRAGRAVGKPVICTILGMFQEAWIQMRGPVIGILSAAWERYLVTRRYDRLLFLSEYSKALTLAWGPVRAETRVVHPGVDVNLHDPTQPKEDIILFVGKYDIRKGLEEVLAVADAMPAVRFRLAGWADGENVYRASSPSNVEWLDTLSYPVLRQEYARAKMLLFPSYAETFGLVVPEAMASGCAVVSSVPLEFEGAHIQAGDRAGIISAVRRLWENPAEMRRAGKANVDLARRYSWEHSTRLLLDVYEAVLSERD